MLPFFTIFLHGYIVRTYVLYVPQALCKYRLRNIFLNTFFSGKTGWIYVNKYFCPFFTIYIYIYIYIYICLWFTCIVCTTGLMQIKTKKYSVIFFSHEKQAKFYVNKIFYPLPQYLRIAILYVHMYCMHYNPYAKIY